MPEQLRDLFDRPSRVIAWGFVALVHVLFWQLLIHGMNIFQIEPVLKAVQVSFMDERAPPVELPKPQVPQVQIPVTDQLFVPTPEVDVTRETPVALTITPVAPPVAQLERVTAVAETESRPIRLLLVSESEVDYLVRPEVRYPLAAKRAREQGTVLLSVVINARGLVDYISVYQSSGHQRLDEAALRAVRPLRVRPYMKNGIAMPVEIRVPVEFSLSGTV